MPNNDTHLVVTHAETPTTPPPRPAGIAWAAFRSRLGQAIQAQEAVLIRYTPVTHSKKRAVLAKNEWVIPLSIQTRNGVEVLFAKDGKTGGLKSFVLSRISAIRLSQTAPDVTPIQRGEG